MELANVLVVARKEIRDALRNRWLQLDAVAFAILTLALSFLSLAGAGSYGFAGYGKTAAGLVNLVILVVPLFGLTIGAGTIAGESDRGTLSYLLAQPVSRDEVLFGKVLGLSGALCAALMFGFGVAGAALALNGVGAEAGSYAAFVGYALLLAIAMLALGVLLSAASPRGSVAAGAALFLWLALAFLSDLGLMGTTIAFKLRVPELFGLALVNPLQSFKLAVLDSVHASLDVLGPAGQYAKQTFGDRLHGLFLASLVVWTITSLAAARVLFERRSAS